MFYKRQHITTDDIFHFFSYFSQKTGFDLSCKLSSKETICMKCQILFSAKIIKHRIICRLLNYFRKWYRLNICICFVRLSCREFQPRLASRFSMLHRCIALVMILVVRGVVQPFHSCVPEVDSCISSFGHIHCCQKRNSCSSRTEWLTVLIQIRRLIMSRLIWINNVCKRIYLGLHS